MKLVHRLIVPLFIVVNLIHAQFTSVDPTGLPYHVVIQNITIDGVTAPSGTMVGLFDGELCVGSQVWNNENENLDIVAWEEDSWADLAGFTSGNVIQVQLYTNIYGQSGTLSASVDVINGNGTYGYGSYTVLDIACQSGFSNSLMASNHEVLFSPTAIGETSIATLSITNTGNVRTLITSFSVNHPEFQLITELDSISPGETKELELWFTPSESISYSSTLTITTDSYETEMIEIQLLGQGMQLAQPMLEVSNSQVTFNTLPTGNTFTEQITLQNTGSSTLVISSIALSEGIQFSLGNSVSEILPGDAHPLNITFQPQGNGHFADLLLISSNSESNTQLAIYLEGHSYTSAFEPVSPTGYPYHIIIEELLVDGRGFQIGDELAVFQDDLCVGTAYITSEVSQLDLVAWGENTLQQLPGFSIGSSFSFRIHTTTFDSSIVMNLEMELVQGDGVFGSGEFSVVHLSAYSGLEPIIAVQNSLLEFSPTQIGEESNAVLSIMNDGETDLVIYQFENTTGHFYCEEQNIVIPSGQSYDATFSFSPTEAIPYSDNIICHSNDLYHPEIMVEVVGQGLQIEFPQLEVSSQPITFNPTVIGDTTIIGLSLFNSGSGILQLTNLELSNEDFQIMENGVSTIDPGQTVDLEIGFIPQNTGAQTCILTVENNSQNQPVFTVSIDGVSYEGFFNSVNPTGLPYTVVIDDIETNTNIDFLPGDEIGIFDGSTCVGVIVIKENLPFSGVCWEMSSTGDMEGFQNGNLIDLRYFSRRNGTPEVRSVAEVFSQGGNFGSGPYSLAQISVEDELIAPIAMGGFPEVILTEDESGALVPIDFNEYFIHPYGDPMTYQVTFDSLFFSYVDYNGAMLILDLASNASGNTELAIHAFDGHSSTVSFLLISITNVNDSPVIAPIDDIVSNEDSPFIVMLSIDDVDGDDLVVTAEDQEGLSELIIDGNELSVVPFPNLFGTSIISITVSDGQEESTELFQYELLPINDAPVLEMVSNLIVQEDSSLTVSLSATDVDGDDLTYSAVSNHEEIGVLISDSLLTITPEYNWYGVTSIYIYVSDSILNDSLEVNIEVVNVDDPPVVLLSIGDLFMVEDATDSNFVDLDSIFQDVDGELDFSVAIADETIGLVSLNESQVVVSLLPNAYGETSIILTASNPSRETVSDTLNLFVSPVNDPPGDFELFSMDSIVVTSESLESNTEFSWTPSVDVDNDVVNYQFELQLIDPNSGNIFLSMDSSIYENNIFIANQSLYDAITSDIQGIYELQWNVVATDSMLTTVSENGSQITILNVVALLSNEHVGIAPLEFSLKQNYPNPFNPSTQIEFTIPNESPIKVVFHNIKGNEVRSINLGMIGPGNYSVRWDGTDDNGKLLASGSYFYSIVTPSKSVFKKLAFIK